MSMTSLSPPKDIRDTLGLHAHRFWREFTALLLVIVELTWLIPWYRSVAQVSYVAPALRTFLVLGGLMVAAYLITLLLESLRLLLGLQRAILLAAFFLSLILAAKLLLDPQVTGLIGGLAGLDQGAVLVILAGLWLWWRGSSLARNPVSPRVVWSRFWLALVMLVAYFLIITRVTGELIGFGLFGIFFSTGLLAMVTARVVTISRFHGAKKNPFGRRWLGFTLLTTALIVGLSLVLASLVTGQFSFLLEQLAQGIRAFVYFLFFLASLPWLFLSYLISPLISTLQNVLPQATVTPTPLAATLEAVRAPYAPPQPPSYRPLSPVFVSLVFWSVVLFVVVAFITNARSQRVRSSREDPEETESLLSSDELLKMLRKSLQKQIQATGDRLANMRRLTRRQRHQAVARIRQIYAQLMDLAAELDAARPEALTPFEFLPGLQSLFPAFEQELASITQAYVEVRYGELPETQAEIDELEIAWKRIAGEGERLKKARRAIAGANTEWAG